MHANVAHDMYKSQKMKLIKTIYCISTLQKLTFRKARCSFSVRKYLIGKHYANLRMAISVNSSSGSLVISFWLLRNVPVNNFSVMLGRSHRFLGIYQYFRELKVSCSGHYTVVARIEPGAYRSGPTLYHLSHRVSPSYKLRYKTNSTVKGLPPSLLG